MTSTGKIELAALSPEVMEGGLARAAGLIAAATMASRGLGLARDVLIAALFGATPVKSALVIALSLPSFVQQLFLGGILSLVFIPTLAEVLVRGDPGETRRVVTSTLNLVLLIGIGLTIAGILAAPLIVPVAAPGYLRTNPAVLATAINLTRVLFISMTFLTLSGFATGFLNAHHRFAVPAAAPLAFNLAIIAGVLVLGPRAGIVGVAVSFVLGWTVQFLVQLPAARRAGLRFGTDMDLHHPAIREMGRLAIPAMLGLAVVEINAYVGRFFASFLSPHPGVDYVAVLDYAFTLNQAPVSIFALSLATALFPTMARWAAAGSPAGLRETTSLGLRGVLLTMLPVTAVIFTLSTPLVRVVFQRGAFSPAATHAVALGLIGFAVGNVAYAGNYVAIRAFYALRDTRTPVRIGLYMIFLNAALDAILMRWLGHVGIALATSLVGFTNLGCLLWVLRGRLQGLEGWSIAGTGLKAGLAASATAGAVLATLRVMTPYVDAARFSGAVIQLLTPLAAGACVYLGACALLGVRELSLLRRLLRFSRAPQL